MQKSDQVLYTTRARVLQAHLRASFPLLDWRVLTWAERRCPPAEFPVPDEVIRRLHRADQDGSFLLVFAPIQINNATGQVAVSVECEAFFAKGLVEGSLSLVEQVTAQLAAVVKSWRGEEGDGR